MSQELQVVQCFSCQTFQTQISKKSKKWICKICNEKQSLKKVYGQGSGKDCRIHCQRLNDLMSKKHTDERTSALLEDSCSQDFETRERTTTMSSGGSKWAKYVSQPSNPDSDDDGEMIRPSQFVLPQCTPESIEIPQAKKFKNDFGKSQVKDTKSMESFFSNDNIFNDVSFHDDDISAPSLSFNPKSKSSQEVDFKSKDKINEKSNNYGNLSKVNFDLFMDDLIEDKDGEAFDDTNSGKCEVSSGSKLEIKRGNNSELNVAIKSSNETKVKQPPVTKHAVFKMVPSDELAVEQLKRKVSLLEDINSYTLEQLTEMCEF